LEWARQAYARLKAQQEAERQAAQAAEDVEAAEAAPPAVADVPCANVPASVQAVQE
jgi:hypothetical protein